jgi:hypothetical protein
MAVPSLRPPPVRLIVMPGLVANLQMHMQETGEEEEVLRRLGTAEEAGLTDNEAASTAPTSSSSRTTYVSTLDPSSRPHVVSASSAIRCLHFSTCSLNSCARYRFHYHMLLPNQFVSLLFYVLGDHLAPLSNINPLSTAHKNQIRNCLAQALKVW